MMQIGVTEENPSWRHPARPTAAVESADVSGSRQDSTRQKRIAGNVAIAAGVISLILIVLISKTYKGVEYHQYAFKRRKASGIVDTDVVHTGGRYPIGITYNFKPFPADAHFLRLQDLRVFSSDRLEVSIDCQLEYFLRLEELSLLHENFDVWYEDVMRDSARDAIKSAATQFSTREYGMIRNQIEDTLFEAVRTRLGGVCCPRWCDVPSGCNKTTCIPRGSCDKKELGMFASVRFFNLLYVSIDENVLARNLLTLTQLEDAKRETFVQAYSLERIKTQEMVEAIGNTANEYAQNATAHSNLIRARATAAAQATLEGAHSQGLALMYSVLNLTAQEEKASLNFLRTLRDHSGVHMMVDFDSLVTTTGFTYECNTN